ncbi:hypothetical protein KC460_01460 [Candidatus Dependentiae bacterium]|nr:hypothetical protein [Candidatus Dependentiae bacterium]
MKKLLIAGLVTILFVGLYAQEGLKEKKLGEKAELFNDKQKELFGGIVKSALEASELPEVKNAGIQLQDSFKNCYMCI